jgi:hypothetical protein
MWLVSTLTGPSVWGQVVAWVIALAVAGRMLGGLAEF